MQYMNFIHLWNEKSKWNQNVELNLQWCEFCSLISNKRPGYSTLLVAVKKKRARVSASRALEQYDCAKRNKKLITSKSSRICRAAESHFSAGAVDDDDKTEMKRASVCRRRRRRRGRRSVCLQCAPLSRVILSHLSSRWFFHTSRSRTSQESTPSVPTFIME